MKLLHTTLIFILICFSSSAYSDKFVDTDHQAENSVTLQILHYLDSSAYLRNVSSEQSILVCQKAILLSEESQDPNLLSKSYKTQGINHYYAGTYDSAFVYYEKSIPQFEAINSKVDIGKVLGNIGLLYRKQGKYDKALEYYLNNLKIYKEANYEEGLGSVFNNLGNLYFETNEFNKAETYYQYALRNFKKFKKTKEIANAYCNLGAVSETRKEFATSLGYYNKSLHENSKIGNILFESKLLFNIGFLLHSQAKLDSAIIYVQRAEDIRIKIGDKDGMVSAKLELARIAIDQQKYALAEKHLLEADKIAVKNSMLKWRAEILESLTIVYRKTGNYKKAYLHQNEMIQISDSLNDIQTTNRFAELSTAYEIEKNQKELELLQQKSQIQNLELGKKNAWIIILMIVMILGAVAIVVSLRINRLRADHKIMDLRQKVLLTQMNPHFLFNSLTAIQSFILDKKNVEANNYLSRLASLVRGILENSREEFVSLRTELETLKDYIGLQKLRFENEISYEFEIDKNIDQDQVLVPPMLAQPFVENALVHGMLRNNPNAKIQVKVSLTKNMDSLRFQIKDNGIGIDEAKKNRQDQNHKSIATSIALDRVKIYNFKSSKKMYFEIIDLNHLDQNSHGTQVCYTIPLLLYCNRS
ncbi:tetratricopeptide repeat-containing sensor histidine kinase [Labilibaculum euxinus]|uniref:Tetratricopeptide repeat protein n=1 Tax=Labilibaculum euxinus TaxID=2686357 RepID=A0A7M4D4Q0_9BACT|nr:tetratricopeptide repeat protein [Labilibaculum euxinus]MUP37629.1 tetratricopeptide repeat protein [Labilibaculum euxinus]MVB06834.1 tetratricopeptide repeat protein [Labilibaculum euxinus]